jgi:phosphoenolpyruvate carboxykinase (ATP)
MVYAEWLARRLDERKSTVWLLNTGWTGGPYGVGRRFPLGYTRAFVTAILDGSLHGQKVEPDPVFGLAVPREVPGVPREMLSPRQTWADKSAYDAKAMELARLFRDNDAKYKITPEVRAAGPRA